MFDTTGSHSGFPFDPALRLGGLFGVVISRTDMADWLQGEDLPPYVRRQIAAKDRSTLTTPTLPKEE